MAAPGCALRFDRIDRWMDLDSFLADDSGRGPDRDCVAYKVQESAACFVDSAIWVAFLDGVCGDRMASGAAVQHDLLEQDFWEALIEERFSENIAHSQPRWRDQLVFERRLFAGRETGDVHGRVPSFLFARPGIDCGVAEQQSVDAANDYSRGGICAAGSRVFAVGQPDDGRGFRRHRCRMGGVRTSTWADSKITHSHNRRKR